MRETSAPTLASRPPARQPGVGCRALSPVFIVCTYVPCPGLGPGISSFAGRDTRAAQHQGYAGSMKSTPPPPAPPPPPFPSLCISCSLSLYLARSLSLFLSVALSLSFSLSLSLSRSLSLSLSLSLERVKTVRGATEAPSWGYPVFVLGAICSFLWGNIVKS